MPYTIEPPPDQSAPPKSKYTIEPPTPADQPSSVMDKLEGFTKAIDPGPFIRGVGQGVIGIPESIYQYAEHLAPGYVPHPGHWADPLRRYRDDVEKTWGGTAGEIVGNIGAFVGGGEVADAIGLANRARSIITSPAARRYLAPIVQSQISQPVSGDDFWTQKGESAAIAHVLSRVLGRAGRQAETNRATQTNEDIARQNADAVRATQEANRTQAEQHQALTEAQEQFHREVRDPLVQTAQTEREQHRALSTAQEQFQQQQRAAAQRAAQEAADRLSSEQGRALAARQAQTDTKAAVPGATTQGWWQRTLAQIGVSNPAATRAAPATGAKVRDIVGGRLNEIMGDMHLDPADPAFTQHIDQIRDEAVKNLPESERGAFYHKPEEAPLKPLLVDPTTGKPLERTTRGIKEKEPEKPTGIFYKTVIEPLQGKDALTGRDLTDYVSRIGAQAEELARAAGREHPQSPLRKVLQDQADALRNVEDAVIGHAAGTPEQKTALETARRAYFMWAIGNDAARASNNGVATPKQLISSMTRRLRGEARYEQAVNDPANPYHDITNWLQEQNTAHTTQVPSAARVRESVPKPPRVEIPSAKPTPIPTPAARQIPPAKPTPIPPPRAQQPPRPQEPVPVPPPPRRPTRSVLGGLTKAGTAGLMYALGHPLGALYTGERALRDIVGHGTPKPEGRAEAWLRQLLTRNPDAVRPATAVIGTVAGQAPAHVPKPVRKIGQAAADALGKKIPGMVFRYVEPQK